MIALNIVVLYALTARWDESQAEIEPFEKKRKPLTLAAQTGTVVRGGGRATDLRNERLNVT